MGLFFDVLSAINNPNQQGTIAQLGVLNSSIQQLAMRYGIQPSQMQGMLLTTGKMLRPALQQQPNLEGNQLQELINQMMGGGTAGLQSILSPDMLQQVSQTIAQQTGVNPSLVQTTLPAVVATALSVLNLGSPKPGVQASNSILNTFLNGDRASDTNFWDVLKLSNRLLYPTL